MLASLNVRMKKLERLLAVTRSTKQEMDATFTQRAEARGSGRI